MMKCVLVIHGEPVLVTDSQMQKQTKCSSSTGLCIRNASATEGLERRLK